MKQKSLRSRLRYSGLVFAGLTATGIGLYLSYFFSDTNPHPVETEVPPLSSLSSAVPTNDAVVARKPITEVLSPAPSPRKSTAPAASLNLTLEGVFLSSEPSKATAMIKNKTGQSRLYRIGESLSDQTRLYAVKRDHVLVLHDEQTVRLELSKTRSNDVLPSANPLPTAFNNSSNRPSSSDPSGYETKPRVNKQEVMNRLQVLRRENFGRDIQN